MVRWSIGPLVECQMLNVIKVKLLSERTSGVPPVIFVIVIVFVDFVFFVIFFVVIFLIFELPLQGFRPPPPKQAMPI